VSISRRLSPVRVLTLLVVAAVTISWLLDALRRCLQEEV
jgi:hypothetical protein